jgi:hypothetical protein
MEDLYVDLFYYDPNFYKVGDFQGLIIKYRVLGSKEQEGKVVTLTWREQCRD